VRLINYLQFQALLVMTGVEGMLLLGAVLPLTENAGFVPIMGFIFGLLGILASFLEVSVCGYMPQTGAK